MLEIYKGENEIYSSAWNPETVIWDEVPGVLALTPNKTIYGDMTMVCYEPLKDGPRNVLFRYWVHTAFLPTSKENDNDDTSDTVAVTQFRDE